MNFLEICQKVDIMSGIQGMIQSVEGTVGAQQVIVNAVQEGFVDLQNERMTWEFMRRSHQFSMLVDKHTYTPLEIFGPPTVPDYAVDPSPTSFGRWQRKKPIISYRIQNPDDGKWSRLIFTDYREFRHHLKNNMDDIGQPRYLTANEQTDELIFNPTPDKEYLVEVDYFVEPQILVGNAQVPILPSRFHMLLVYRGLERVGNHYGNVGLYGRYSLADSKMTGNLYRDQVPGEVVRIRSVA